VQKLESLGLLAGGIAHDFNNLLMAILGNAELALEDLPLDSPGHPSLDNIKEITLRAADLCKQMLAYSGRGKFVIEPVDLSLLAGEMTKLMEVSISKKAVLRYNLAKDLPSVKGDSAQLRQVIMNLVINASEAIGSQNGVISLTTDVMDCDEATLRRSYISEKCQPGRYVSLEVSDTGCGMSHDTIARLFDPFFTTKFTGRGLGLAATLGIVRGHHGAIKVSSEPGRGSTFKVLLPAGEACPVVHKKPPLSTAWRGSGTLLLVDDEEMVLTVAKRMLEHLGFTVATASDGREAVYLVKCRGDEFSCILMDLTMPHLGGEEAFLQISKLRTDIPVILSSGYNPPEVEARFLGEGMAGFIQKPYQLSSLVEVLQRVPLRRVG
jgi:CheY-like chemotaxis protein